MLQTSHSALPRKHLLQYTQHTWLISDCLVSPANTLMPEMQSLFYTTVIDDTGIFYSVLRNFWVCLRCPVGCSLGYANITSLRDWSVACTPFYHKDLFTVTKWKGKQETLILNLSTFSSTRVEGLKKKVARQWGEPKSQGQGWVQVMCLYWKLPLLTDTTLCRHLLLILCFLK